MIRTSPTELSDGFDDFLDNDSPRYSDDHAQNARLQATKQVNGFTPIPMDTPQSNIQKKKPINKGFMAIPMDESPQPQKVTPPPKPKSLGSRLLRKNTIDKAIDTASMLTADTSLLGGPSAIQKVPSKEKQQFQPIDDFDDGVSGIDGLQGNVPPISEIPSTLNPFTIPPIPKKLPLSQSNSSNHSTSVSSNHPLSGAESFQLFTQLPPIPLPPSNQNPLSAAKKNPVSQIPDSQQAQISNKVQFAPTHHQQGRFDQQLNQENEFRPDQQYQQQQINDNNLIAQNENTVNPNQQIRMQDSFPPSSVHNTSPRFQERNDVFMQNQGNEPNLQYQQNDSPQNFTFGNDMNSIPHQAQNFNTQQNNQFIQQSQFPNSQIQDIQFNQNSQQYQQHPISGQQIQQQPSSNSLIQNKIFDQQIQQKPLSDQLYQNQQNYTQSQIYQQNLNTRAAQPLPIAPSSHSYQPLFNGPLGSLEINFVYTLNRSSSTLKRLFTGEFTNLMKQQSQTSTSFESLDIDEYANSITSEISQIIEAPIQSNEINQTGISRRISTVIDEETKLMTIGLREVDAKNSTAMENQVNELKKLQIELESLNNAVKLNTDEILREFEKERSDAISMREFSQSFVNELERRARSIQIKQVELSSKATHQSVEKESIERMMKQLNQKKQNFNPYDPVIPERGATYGELISNEMSKIRQIIRQSIADDNDDDYDIQNKSISSQSIISPASSVVDESIRILQDELEAQKKEFMSLQLSNRLLIAQSQPQSRISTLNQTSFQPTALNNDLIRKTRGTNNY